ncbi:thioredoxin, partial [Teladorsagia circumcincta]
EQHSPVKLAKVDCVAEKELDQRFDIKGYPTVKLLKYGDIIADYDRARKADAIVEFMIEHSGEASKSTTKEGVVAVLTDSNFDEFVKEHELCLVDFYAP